MKVKRTPGEGAKKLRILLKALENVEGEVGYFESAKYPDGTPVAYVAAIQEFGFQDGKKIIPPRSSFRTTIKTKKQVWRKLSRDYAKQIAAGNINSYDAMQGITLQAAGDVREKIRTIWEPKLKESTIKARRRLYANKSKNAPVSEKPLVSFHKLLLNKLTNVVRKK